MVRSVDQDADANISKTLNRWREGQPLSAKHLNESVELLKGMTEGIRPPRQMPRLPFVPPPDLARETFVVVVFIGTNQDNHLIVHRVIPKIVEGSWRGEFELTGNPESMPVWPNQRAGDYAAFLWQEQELSVETPILQAVRVGDTWWLPQYLRFRLPTPDQSVVMGDCTPHIVGAA